MATSTFIAIALLAGVDAFSTSTAAKGTLTARFGYVPDGFTQESYAKFKADEKKNKKSSNLGHVGPRGFESRSLRSFQEAREIGETSHLLPVMNWKEKLTKGKIKRGDVPVSWLVFSQIAVRCAVGVLQCTISSISQEFVFNNTQYMQRGGKWDNSDVQGAKNRKKWLNSDKEYAADESKKQNSFSILGWGKGLDWTGTQDPSAGPAAKFGRNYKAPNVRFMKSDEKSTVSKPIKKKKNKLFGIF
jgi:hypothetical protein